MIDLDNMNIQCPLNILASAPSIRLYEALVTDIICGSLKPFSKFTDFCVSYGNKLTDKILNGVTFWLSHSAPFSTRYGNIWRTCYTECQERHFCVINISIMEKILANTALVLMACRLCGAKPLPETMLAHWQLDSWEHISATVESEFYHFHSRKCIWNYRLPKSRLFVQGRWVNSMLIIMISTSPCV